MVSEFFNYETTTGRMECKEEHLFVGMLFEDSIVDNPDEMRHFIKQGLREFVKKMYADGFFDLTVNERIDFNGCEQAILSLRVYLPNYRDRRDRSKKTLPLID